MEGWKNGKWNVEAIAEIPLRRENVGKMLRQPLAPIFRGNPDSSGEYWKITNPSSGHRPSKDELNKPMIGDNYLRQTIINITKQ